MLADPDKSALRILLAIFFWFLGYNAIEAFFTLYAQKHLGLPEADGARLLGQLSLIFVIFALPAGYIGARIGRRKTILTGIALMALHHSGDLPAAHRHPDHPPDQAPGAGRRAGDRSAA